SSGLGGRPSASGLGGLQGGLGNSALASALRLPSLGGAAATPSALEMQQLLRALAARSTGAAADSAGGAAPLAADDIEVRLNKLNRDITLAMNKELDQVRENQKKTLQQLLEASKDVNELRTRVEAI